MANKRKYDDRETAAIDNTVASGELIYLDRGGDVILVISSPPTTENPSTKRFLADSGHLILASRYFEARFKTIYGEGQQVQDGRCPEIPLRDDDVEAMGVILNKLHHINLPNHRFLDAMTVEAVARQCDKYALTEALGGWMHRWVELGLHMLFDADDHASLAVAAHIFQEADLLERVAVNATYALNAEQSEKFQRKVQTITGRYVRDLRMVTELCHLSSELKRAIETGMQSLMLEEGQVVQYISSLDQNQLWPVSSAFETKSLQTIVYIVESLPHKLDAERHGGLGDCFELLVAKAKNITNFMQGLPSHFAMRELRRKVDLSKGAEGN